jgi:hypothetical protein
MRKLIISCSLDQLPSSNLTGDRQHNVLRYRVTKVQVLTFQEVSTGYIRRKTRQIQQIRGTPRSLVSFLEGFRFLVLANHPISLLRYARSDHPLIQTTQTFANFSQPLETL